MVLCLRGAVGEKGIWVAACAGHLWEKAIWEAACPEEIYKDPVRRLGIQPEHDLTDDAV